MNDEHCNKSILVLNKYSPPSRPEDEWISEPTVWQGGYMHNIHTIPRNVWGNQAPDHSFYLSDQSAAGEKQKFGHISMIRVIKKTRWPVQGVNSALYVSVSIHAVSFSPSPKFLHSKLCKLQFFLLTKALLPVQLVMWKRFISVTAELHYQTRNCLVFLTMEWVA